GAGADGDSVSGRVGVDIGPGPAAGGVAADRHRLLRACAATAAGGARAGDPAYAAGPACVPIRSAGGHQLWPVVGAYRLRPAGAGPDRGCGPRLRASLV